MMGEQCGPSGALAVILGGEQGGSEIERELSTRLETAGRFGLTLTESDYKMLAERRESSLRARGRVEFGQSPLGPLTEVFCDSPYIEQARFATQLAELLDIFYALKNEAGDLAPDRELMELMRWRFDSSGGSLERVSDLALDGLLGLL